MINDLSGPFFENQQTGRCGHYFPHYIMVFSVRVRSTDQRKQLTISVIHCIHCGYYYKNDGQSKRCTSSYDEEIIGDELTTVIGQIKQLQKKYETMKDYQSIRNNHLNRIQKNRKILSS